MCHRHCEGHPAELPLQMCWPGQGSVPKTATPGTPETGSRSATLKGQEGYRTSHLHYPIGLIIYSCDHRKSLRNITSRP